MRNPAWQTADGKADADILAANGRAEEAEPTGALAPPAAGQFLALRIEEAIRRVSETTPSPDIRLFATAVSMNDL